MSSKVPSEKLSCRRFRIHESKTTKYTIDKTYERAPFKQFSTNFLKTGYFGLYPGSMRIIMRLNSRNVVPTRMKKVRLLMFRSKLLDSKPRTLNFCEKNFEWWSPILKSVQIHSFMDSKLNETEFSRGLQKIVKLAGIRVSTKTWNSMIWSCTIDKTTKLKLAAAQEYMITFAIFRTPTIEAIACATAYT